MLDPTVVRVDFFQWGVDWSELVHWVCRCGEDGEAMGFQLALNAADLHTQEHL